MTAGSQHAPSYHEPVMVGDVVKWLSPRPQGRYCDGTLGGGGYSKAILEHSTPGGRVLGIDRDPEALDRCRQELAPFADRLIVRHGTFAEIASLVASIGWDHVDGAVLDLGVSSHQLSDPNRGFSFAGAGPIDMRMDPDQPKDAKSLIESLNEADLAALIYRYGEERYSRRIAAAIKRSAREGHLRTTADLANTIYRAVPKPYTRTRIHPATRTFQALRIAVNDELEQLHRFLADVFGVVKPGGRVVIVSFHSLEDRQVKRAFQILAGRRRGDQQLELNLRAVDGDRVAPVVAILTKKPMRPSDAETAINPRARSARLRAAERLS